MPLRFFSRCRLGLARTCSWDIEMASIYMNLQRLDSSIQGLLGEAERLTTAIEFEVAYIPDILPTTTMLGQTTSTRHNHYITKSTRPSRFSSRIEIIAHNIRGQAGRSGYEAKLWYCLVLLLFYCCILRVM